MTWRRRKYVPTYEGFGRPWSHLEERAELDVESLFAGAGYVAWGVTRGSGDTA